MVFTSPRLEATGRDGVDLTSLRTGAASKCQGTMTVFNQENVEEFYHIGDELGR